MESIPIKQTENLLLCKKIKRKEKSKEVISFPKDEKQIEKLMSMNSLDASSEVSTEVNNNISYSQIIKKNPTPTDNKIISLEEIVIPEFLNDITKYDEINKKIKKYYKTLSYFNNPNEAEIYLIDVNRLYEERRKLRKISN